MTPASLESHVDRAADARAVLLAFEFAAFTGGPEPLAPVPDVAPLAGAYPTASAADPAGAVLLAEAVARGSMRVPCRAYRTAWKKDPITLRGEAPIALESLRSLLALEPNEHRRQAIAREADARAQAHLAVARDVVDATREIASRLGLHDATSLHAAVGFGAAADVRRASDTVLLATTEAFRELDGWVRGRLGLPRQGELTWPDRLRTLATPHANERIPQGDRAAIASRWIERIGLGESLRRVRDRTARASVDGIGLRVFADTPAEDVRIAGTASLSAIGLMDLAGATAEALSLAIPSEMRMAERLGVDRIHAVVAERLGRGLLLAPIFVTREASVDRGSRESVIMELLHATILDARRDAALARFGLDALARAGDLPARFREALSDSIGTAPPPAWAAHAGAHVFALRAGARTVATLLEARWFAGLRDLHDEDWFRNPRAGESVKAQLDAMRARGAIDAFLPAPDERDSLFDSAPLARRYAEAMDAARSRVS